VTRLDASPRSSAGITLSGPVLAGVNTNGRENPTIRQVVPALASTPIAPPRHSGGMIAVAFASASGWVSGAPAPCTSRATINASSDGATAQASDDTPKTAIPSRNSRRRPKRSASRPEPAINDASDRRYAPTTHWTSA
jgi:hypothetical protein